MAINTRIKNKHDTEAHWQLASNFIPLAGEIIIYDADATHNHCRIKIGDGATYVNNLPFILDEDSLLTEEDKNALASIPRIHVGPNPPPTNDYLLWIDTDEEADAAPLQIATDGRVWIGEDEPPNNDYVLWFPQTSGSTDTPQPMTFVNSINGQSGNVMLTINNVAPDSNGNFELDLAPSITINGENPDVNGNFELPPGVTAVAFNNGTTNGPTLQLSQGSATPLTAIVPTATNSRSGVLSTGAQTIAGNKTFTGEITATKVYGAVWNDYAEYRQAETNVLPGYCVIETGNDTLELSSSHLQPAAYVVSDTFGFAIGKTNLCNTPVAVAGRVLAYVNGNRDEYRAGDCVCAGPNGKLDLMTRTEVQQYPDRVIGVVSCVPSYSSWGENNALVDGRVWIKLK